MSSKSSRTPPNSGGQVVVQLDARLFYGVVAVIGVLAIFFIAFFLGRLSSGGGAASQPVYQNPAQVVPQGQTLQVQPGTQQQIQIPQSTGAQPGVAQVQGGQQPPQAGQDPNKLRPADPAKVAIAPDAPRLALPELVEKDYNWDFGSISPNEPAEKVFKLKNIGNKDLKITNVTSSCGCTAALVSENTIPAGQEAQLRVTYDPRVNKDKNAPITRYIDILSNDPAADQVRFTITAFVRDQ
ncbi:MAG: DUF1573 domain-containing protein [Chloroflexi bacterium]|nr:DUF1573 domain-containing protein [Chloroflexota bacterium]